MAEKIAPRAYLMAKLALALILLISVLNFLSISRDWYDTVWWFDIPMHFLGGAWMGVLFGYLFFEKLKFSSASFHFLSYLLISFGLMALVGIGWELFEYFRDIYLAGYVREDVLDTLADLLNNLIGNTVSASFIWRYRRSLDS